MGTVKQNCLNYEQCGNLCVVATFRGQERLASAWCGECQTLLLDDKFYLIGWTDAWPLSTLARDYQEAYEMGVNDRLGIANEE